MTRHSRRTILGGAVALPFIATPAVAALGVDRSAWTAAMSAYRSANAAWLGASAAFNEADQRAVDLWCNEPIPAGETTEQSRARAEGHRITTGYHAADKAADAALKAQCAALHRLVGEPAPDVRAWADRFALLVDDDFQNDKDVDWITATVATDLARLMEAANA